MNILFTSFKGGVGCSSLAYAMALITQFNKLYSSDQYLIPDAMLVKVQSKEHFEQIKEPSNLIMDFSMTRNLALAEHAISVADVIMIPCQTDANGIKMAVQLYNQLTQQQKSCFILINGFRGERSFKQAQSQLEIAGITFNKIIALKDTRLMDRLIANGPTWFTEVHNERGLHKLRDTIREFEQLLRAKLQF